MLHVPLTAAFQLQNHIHYCLHKFYLIGVTVHQLAAWLPALVSASVNSWPANCTRVLQCELTAFKCTRIGCGMSHRSAHSAIAATSLSTMSTENCNTASLEGACAGTHALTRQAHKGQCAKGHCAAQSNDPDTCHTAAIAMGQSSLQPVLCRTSKPGCQPSHCGMMIMSCLHSVTAFCPGKCRAEGRRVLPIHDRDCHSCTLK